MHKRKRKRYTPEFRQEALRAVESRGSRTIGDVAKSLGVGESFESSRAANTVNVSQCDLYTLVAWDVDAG